MKQTMKKIANFFGNLNLFLVLRYTAIAAILFMFSIGADKGVTSFAFWGMVLAVVTLMVATTCEGYRKGLMEGLEDGFKAGHARGLQEQLDMPEFGRQLVAEINKQMATQDGMTVDIEGIQYKKEEQKDTAPTQEQIDAILDKISFKQELTPKEKEILKNLK